MTEELSGGCFDEREAFEATYVQYAQALGAGFESIADLRMGEEYQSHYITGMWEGWKLRASLSTSKQAGAEPVAYLLNAAFTTAAPFNQGN